jgi:RNA polymerase sigma-70 factor (ECF subfamily)
MTPEPDSDAESRADAAFCTTHWSLVLAAGQPSHPAANDALSQLCERYWYPLYAFVRRKGHSPDEAQDFTQGFFAVLLEKNFLNSVDCDRGRFRTFMLAAFEHFVQNERKKQRTLKRGGGVTFVPWQIDDAEDRYQQEPADRMTPEAIFEYRWALSVLEIAGERLRSEFVKAGKERDFDALEVFLSGDKRHVSYAEVAQKLDRSEAAVRVAVHRLRSRYGELLRITVSQTIVDPRDRDDELRRLLAALSA